MDETKTTLKTRYPLFLIIAATAFATLIVTAAALYFAGYLGSHADSGAVPTAQTEGHAPSGVEKQLYTCGMHPWIISEEPGNCPICGMKLVPKREESKDTAAEAKGERKVLYWRAPMNPLEIYEKPGKSAMGMDLVAVYEDEVVGGVEIKVDPVTRQNMGIRTATAQKGSLHHTIRTYGHITFDETRMAEISPKFNGWIEKLYIDFTGQTVEKNEPLFDIYSPELTTAQEEYLVAFRSAGPYIAGKNAMIASVRRRLDYFDVPQREIHALEKSGIVKKALTIRSPFKGTVIHKNALEGGYVKAGTAVYRIADLSKIWVEAHIYEYELDLVKTGQSARMTLPYLPGRVYTGKIAFVYPYLQQQTRDVVIRIEFDNPDFELKPDMYADIRIETGTGEGLLIPDEAVLRSGERNIVFVAKEGGKFSPRQVTLGINADGGNVQVLSGLAPGETVVTSGQFLLDSESKLKEAIQKMMEPKQEKQSTEQQVDAEKQTDEDDFFEDM